MKACRLKDMPKSIKRCSDYDNDCTLVKDKLACFNGVSRMHKGVVYYTDKADGYCPYLINQ